MKQTFIHIGMPVLGLLVIGALLVSLRQDPSYQRAGQTAPAVLSAQSSTSPFTVVTGSPTIQGTPVATTRRYSIPVTVTNIGNQLLQIAPGLQMFIADATGNMIPATAEYIDPALQIGGTVTPGGIQSQTIDFSMPADFHPTSFIFDYDAQNRTEVTL